VIAGQRELLASGASAVALALALLVLRPAERARARNMLIVALLLALAQTINTLASGIAPNGSNAINGWIGDLVYLGFVALVIRLGAMLLFRSVLPLLRLNLPRIIEDLLTTLMVVVWAGMWLRMSGMDFSSVVTTSAVLTGIIAFSMQETLGNILGGLALQFDSSIRVGDWVRIDDLSGRVVEVRWRYTAIETRNRETVVVPNSQLMRGRFMVIGSRDGSALRWRRSLNFALVSEAGVHRIREVLERAVIDADIAGVAREPAPSTVLADLLPGGGRFVLRYWLTDPQHDEFTDGEVRMHCEAALARNGIQVAVPVEEHHIVKENEGFHSARKAAEQRLRVAALRKVDLFGTLVDDELAELASHLTHAPFAAGDVMTRQGAIAHWLYLIVSGEAEVWVEGAQGTRAQVATIGSGNVFGEMGMMTGEPRRATVIARTHVDCYRLGKDGFRQILAIRPDIASEIAKVLAERKVALVQQQSSADNARRQSSHTDILASIRSFFAL
jgi:small-conductance mechanosensitive channel